MTASIPSETRRATYVLFFPVVRPPHVTTDRRVLLTCRRSLHLRSGGPLINRCVHWHVSVTVLCRLLTRLILLQSQLPRRNHVPPRSLTFLRTARPPAPYRSPHAELCPHREAPDGLHIDRACPAPAT